MKKKLKIGLLIFLIPTILYFGHYIYTHFIHYKLHYIGHSANKINSIKNKTFISEFAPEVNNLNINNSNTFLENAILEQSWKSIGNPEVYENEKYLTGSYQLIVPIELGVFDLEIISSKGNLSGKQGYGYPIDMLVFETKPDLQEIMFAVEVRNGETWDETIIIDTITYRKVN
jgi:hypothetical protein